MATIPRIVLDDRAVDNSDPSSTSTSPSPSPLMTTSTTTNGPKRMTTTTTTTGGTGGGGGGRRPLSGGGGGGGDESLEPYHDYIPHRCNSDIGLPTTSMPNLPLAMGLGGPGEHGEGGDKLGVYCSPRTTRRSVDLEVGGSSARDPSGGVGGGRVEYEWLEDKTSSLQVLSAGSRVGSAISLNSVCTAHSVGLLSNDSSDEYQDSFLQDVSLLTFPHTERASHLRRLQSNPEAEDKSGSESNVTPRTSYSLCNLKAAQGPATLGGKGQGQPPRGQLTPEKLCLLPSEVDECGEDNTAVPVPPPAGEKEKGGKEDETSSKVSEMEVCEDSPQASMVSYGKGSNTMREGRIRRWLQDMDKATE